MYKSLRFCIWSFLPAHTSTFMTKKLNFLWIETSRINNILTDSGAKLNLISLIPGLLCLNSKSPYIPFSVPFLKYLPPEEELNHHTDPWQIPRERITRQKYSQGNSATWLNWLTMQVAYLNTNTAQTLSHIAILFFSQQRVEFKIKSEYLCEVILWGEILFYWNPKVGYILHLWNLIFFLSVT